MRKFGWRIQMGLLILCVGLIIPAYAGAEAASVFKLESGENAVKVGDSFTVRLSGAEMSQLYAIEASLSFDSQKLELLNAEGIATGYAGQWSDGGNTAKVYLTKLGNASMNGAAELIEITFKARQAGNASIALQSVEVETAAGARQVYDGNSEVTLVLQPTGGALIYVPPAPTPAAELVSKRPGANQEVTAYLLDQGIFHRELEGLVNKPAADKRIDIALQRESEAQAVLFTAPDGLLMSASASDPEAVIELMVDDEIRYELPLTLFSTQLLAKLLETTEELIANADVEISIGLSSLPLPVAAGHTLISSTVEFSIVVRLADGSELLLERFGDQLINRSILIDAEVDEQIAGGIAYDASTGVISYVPTVFNKQQGQTWAVMKRNGNSVYAVISDHRTFPDVMGHWAQPEMEKLASKLLLKGRSEQAFAPNEAVTRAEFAALLVRGLGLKEAAADTTLRFNDTNELAWYAGSVAAAVEAGLVSGYTDGSFRPNAPISREQMAIMLTRALEVAGMKLASNTDQSALQAFRDNSEISTWALEAADALVSAGLMQGISNTSFAPQATATRAQAAVMLNRVLLYAKLMS